MEIKGGGDAVSAARAVLQTGEYDLAYNLQVEDEILQRLEAGGKGRVVFSQGSQIEHILLNAADPNVEVDGERASPKSRHPVLSDPSVRQALALLLDRQSVQQFIYGRAAFATANYLNNPLLYRSANTRAEFNVDKANALLDWAGWARGAGGVREKGGRRLLLLFQTTTNAPRQKTQSIFKQACQQAGIALELKSVQAAVFFSSDEANPDTFGKFWADLLMSAWFSGSPDPAPTMRGFTRAQLSAKANKWQGNNGGRTNWCRKDRMTWTVYPTNVGSGQRHRSPRVAFPALKADRHGSPHETRRRGSAHSQHRLDAANQACATDCGDQDIGARRQVGWQRHAQSREMAALRPLNCLA